jgi:SAM-dependent methyltransferase
MSRPKFLATEDDVKVADLRARLDAFYASTDSYLDFNVEANSKPLFWTPIKAAIAEQVAAKGSCAVLEFGAGRTGFARFLGDIRHRVRFDVQDVTSQNRDFLAGEANAVHIGDLQGVSGQYDVIFSTFVWEHVTNPRQTLDKVLSLLAPGGSLFIACPKYDIPFYTPPSARHYALGKRLGMFAWQATRRWRADKERFIIHTDPAVLHGPWYRDADAIHWVSLTDFHQLPRGFRCERVPVSVRGLRGWIFTRLLLAFVRITREDQT